MFFNKQDNSRHGALRTESRAGGRKTETVSRVTPGLTDAVAQAEGTEGARSLSQTLTLTLTITNPNLTSNPSPDPNTNPNP